MGSGRSVRAAQSKQCGGCGNGYQPNHVWHAEKAGPVLQPGNRPMAGTHVEPATKQNAQRLTGRFYIQIRHLLEARSGVEPDWTDLQSVA